MTPWSSEGWFKKIGGYKSDHAGRTSSGDGQFNQNGPTHYGGNDSPPPTIPSAAGGSSGSQAPPPQVVYVRDSPRPWWRDAAWALVFLMAIANADKVFAFGEWASGAAHWAFGAARAGLAGVSTPPSLTTKTTNPQPSLEQKTPEKNPEIEQNKKLESAVARLQDENTRLEREKNALKRKLNDSEGGSVEVIARRASRVTVPSWWDETTIAKMVGEWAQSCAVPLESVARNGRRITFPTVCPAGTFDILQSSQPVK